MSEYIDVDYCGIKTKIPFPYYIIEVRDGTDFSIVDEKRFDDFEIFLKHYRELKKEPVAIVRGFSVSKDLVMTRLDKNGGVLSRAGIPCTKRFHFGKDESGNLTPAWLTGEDEYIFVNDN